MTITTKQKKDFILYASIAFCVGAVLYFSLPYISYLIPDSETFTDSIGFGLARIFGGGYLIMSIISAILFAIYIYPKLSKTIKILSIVFFMFTFMIFILAAYILSVPVYIYCVYSLIKRKNLE